MIKTIYLRISNKTNQVKASYRRSYEVLKKEGNYSQFNKYYPTITIKLNVEIPDEFFAQAQKELNLKIENLNINSDIKLGEIK
ncbi:MAG: hypothetical protein AABY22_20620 [Nanoarchaeota archaeon]